MKIGKVQPVPIKVPRRVERKVKKEQPIPVEMPQKKEQHEPAKT